MNRITRLGAHLSVTMACCVMTALLAGCDFGSSTPTPASAPAGVFVTTATQWSSEHPGATYTTVLSLSPDTGKVRWQHREEWFPYHEFPGQPVVVQGVVYMVADTNTTSTDPAHPLSGILLALSASDGHQLWRKEIGALASQPVVDGNTVYVSAQHLVGSSGLAKEVYALDSRDGSVRWKTEIADTRTISDTLVLSQGRLFLSASQLCFDSCTAAFLFALDAGSGHILWRQSFTGNVTIQPPTVNGSVVYARVPGYGTGWFALSVADGHQLWQANVDNVLVRGGVVYTDEVVGHLDPQRPDLAKHAIVALDGQTGMERWQSPTDTYPAVLTVEGNDIIVKSEIPNPRAGQTTSPYLDVLMALGVGDGRQLWRAPQDAYGTTVASAGGILYVTLPPTTYSGQTQVAALHAADGTVLWRQPVGPAHPRSGPGLLGYGDIALTGTLFCVSSAGILYGIRTTDGHTLWSADVSASGQLGGITVIT